MKENGRTIGMKLACSLSEQCHATWISQWACKFHLDILTLSFILSIILNFLSIRKYNLPRYFFNLKLTVNDSFYIYLDILLFIIIVGKQTIITVGIKKGCSCQSVQTVQRNAKLRSTHKLHTWVSLILPRNGKAVFSCLLGVRVSGKQHNNSFWNYENLPSPPNFPFDKIPGPNERFHPYELFPKSDSTWKPG